MSDVKKWWYYTPDWDPSFMSEDAPDVGENTRGPFVLASDYDAKCAELEAERSLSEACSRDCNATALERNALRAELTRLRAALERHGDHDIDCEFSRHERVECSCGFAAALAGLPSQRSLASSTEKP